MKTVAQVYEQILDLYKDPARFAKDYYQYDKNGNKCPWREGHCFCVLGAICYFTNINGENNTPILGLFSLQHVATCLLQRVSEHLYQKHIQAVNDAYDGYENVVKALQFAKNLWEGRTPTVDDLSKPLNNL